MMIEVVSEWQINLPIKLYFLVGSRFRVVIWVQKPITSYGGNIMQLHFTAATNQQATTVFLPFILEQLPRAGSCASQLET